MILTQLLDQVLIVAARLGHYFSTHCQHGHHGDCKLTCKHCPKRCRCRCHRPGRVLGDG